METEIISNAIIIKMKKYVFVNVVVRNFPDIGSSCVRHFRITHYTQKKAICSCMMLVGNRRGIKGNMK